MRYIISPLLPASALSRAPTFVVFSLACSFIRDLSSKWQKYIWLSYRSLAHNGYFSDGSLRLAFHREKLWASDPPRKSFPRFPLHIRAIIGGRNDRLSLYSLRFLPNGDSSRFLFQRDKRSFANTRVIRAKMRTLERLSSGVRLISLLERLIGRWTRTCRQRN